MRASLAFHRDDRAVSITVTHVLTIAITAALISGLMIGAGTMLESEREQGAQGSLQTIGERLGGELAAVDRLADDGPENASNVSLRVDQPRRVAGSVYTVDLTTCTSPLVNESEHCLVLVAQDEDVEEQVPVAIDASRIGSSGSIYGGEITITYEAAEDEIRLEEGHR